MKKIWRFIKEAKAELSRATWPTWEDITRSTVVVFITVIIFTIFIYLLDQGVSSILEKVFG